jgi:hypothetical protein
MGSQYDVDRKGETRSKDQGVLQGDDNTLTEFPPLSRPSRSPDPQSFSQSFSPQPRQELGALRSDVVSALLVIFRLAAAFLPFLPPHTLFLSL